jgi:hypothetical protein
LDTAAVVVTAGADDGFSLEQPAANKAARLNVQNKRDIFMGDIFQTCGLMSRAECGHFHFRNLGSSDIRLVIRLDVGRRRRVASQTTNTTAAPKNAAPIASNIFVPRSGPVSAVPATALVETALLTAGALVISLVTGFFSGLVIVGGSGIAVTSGTTGVTTWVGMGGEMVITGFVWTGAGLATVFVASNRTVAVTSVPSAFPTMIKGGSSITGGRGGAVCTGAGAAFTTTGKGGKGGTVTSAGG